VPVGLAPSVCLLDSSISALVSNCRFVNFSLTALDVSFSSCPPTQNDFTAYLKVVKSSVLELLGFNFCADFFPKDMFYLSHCPVI
jgi:hypothetical protein